jgi:hypothetical protein
MMWYYRNVLYFEQGLERDPRVLLVRYEALVTRPEQEFPRIFQFLNIPYSPWISRHVFASSVRRKAPPVIDQPIQTLCQGLSERFDAAVRDQGLQEAA